MMKNKITAGSWLSSDEIFLQQIAADEVRAKAKKDGFHERLVFQIDASFDWHQVEQALNNRSLFSDKQLLELRFLQDKFSDADRKALQACCEKLNPDILLLILSHKIEAQTKKAKWFVEITNKINFVPIWPISAQQYLAWLKARSDHYQLQIEQSALQLLAKQTQGNVLAADQILQQLKLINNNELITTNMITEFTQSAIQTDLFTFVDIFLNAQNANTLKHLELLKAQGIEPILIIWALARELRTLNAMQLGENPYVWPSRQALIHQALKLFPNAKIHKLMQQLANIDLYIKGAKRGDPWLALERLIVC